MNQRPLKVFISYKWENETHNNWVERFATDLRIAGIDAKLDKWEVRLGDSFTDYMTSKIAEADVVLFIMTTQSVAAAEAQKGSGGSVKFEIQIATSRRIAGENMRLIGIYREGNQTPSHLRDHRYIDFRDDSRYQIKMIELIDDLLGKVKPPLLGSMLSREPLQFYSCFISYSYKDEEFAKMLYSRLRVENIRAWFAPEDLRGGVKLHEEIERAIQIHDRLLLILSEHSMQSEWVKTEIAKARRIEVRENRRKLFPIRLVNLDTIIRWECFDRLSGKNLATEIREYYIPDFSDWRNYGFFEASFSHLLRALEIKHSDRNRRLCCINQNKE